jgi:hypothetical protein
MKNQVTQQADRPPSTITAGGVLLCAAESAFGDPDQTTPADSAFNRDLVTGILAAATVGGYEQTHILGAALITGEYSERVLDMADKACRAAGSVALRAVLDRALAGRSSTQKPPFPEMFRANANGGYDMSPAGMLVLAAHTYYRLKHENTQERIASAKQFMQGVLAEARTVGYSRISQLSAALVSGDRSPRTTTMANQACAKVPTEKMRQFIDQANFS